MQLTEYLYLSTYPQFALFELLYFLVYIKVLDSSERRQKKDDTISRFFML